MHAHGRGPFGDACGLRKNWKTPARALGLGMPLAMAGMAVVAHYLVGLDWTTSFLVGAALLVFGALLTPQLFGDLPVGGYVAVVLAIVLIRPASLLVSLLGARIERREKLVAAWFGPKGFASVVYGLLVLQAGIPQGEKAYTLIAVCIAFSIIAHSSTDVPIARLFQVADLAGIPAEPSPPTDAAPHPTAAVPSPSSAPDQEKIHAGP
ncbi:cation:proton antiporter [Streptomyces sp. H27-G5]|uniref:cation:proton antiporter domain-containing protein n=1 Tax=Streptomyces sp. H27-G5 TaxID=2996698 RepID=UPI003B6331D9